MAMTPAPVWKIYIELNGQQISHNRTKRKYLRQLDIAVMLEQSLPNIIGRYKFEADGYFSLDGVARAGRVLVTLFSPTSSVTH